MSRTIPLFVKVITGRRAVEGDACWAWTKKVNKRTGYGELGHRGRHYLAHRVAHEVFIGPIPPGLTVDHLCGNRACVRPDHLEAVTQAENNRRALLGMPSPRRGDFSPTCRKGHERKWAPSGWHCPTCRGDQPGSWKRGSETCRRGHNDWVQMTNGYRRCRTCQQEANREAAKR